MMKKFKQTNYFQFTEGDRTKIIRLDSHEQFTDEQAIEQLKGWHPKATDIKPISEKVALLLNGFGID